MRRGLRLEAIAQQSPNTAWAQFAGRNLDGSTYRFSERWVRVHGLWHYRNTPLPEDLSSLPPLWPPHYQSYALRVIDMELVILLQLDPALAKNLDELLQRNLGLEKTSDKLEKKHKAGEEE
jgi:hypothetical protein